jgi:hypothetical protein
VLMGCGQGGKAAGRRRLWVVGDNRWAAVEAKACRNDLRKLRRRVVVQFGNSGFGDGGERGLGGREKRRSSAAAGSGGGSGGGSRRSRRTVARG